MIFKIILFPIEGVEDMHKEWGAVSIREKLVAPKVGSGVMWFGLRSLSNIGVRRIVVFIVYSINAMLEHWILWCHWSRRWLWMIGGWKYFITVLSWGNIPLLFWGNNLELVQIVLGCLEYGFISHEFLLHSEEKWFPLDQWNWQHLDWLWFIFDRWNFQYLFFVLFPSLSFLLFPLSTKKPCGVTVETLMNCLTWVSFHIVYRWIKNNPDTFFLGFQFYKFTFSIILLKLLQRDRF